MSEDGRAREMSMCRSGSSRREEIKTSTYRDFPLVVTKKIPIIEVYTFIQRL